MAPLLFALEFPPNPVQWGVILLATRRASRLLELGPSTGRLVSATIVSE